MDNMNVLCNDLTLSELKLPKPPRGGGISHNVRLERRKGSVSTEKQHRIILQRIDLFGFRFCFANENAKQDPLRYGFIAVPFFDELHIKDSLWLPPCWAAMPLGRNKQLRIFKWVDWSVNYHERFQNHSLKMELKNLLLQKHHDLTQKQTELKF